jgi:hypothetical protein
VISTAGFELMASSELRGRNSPISAHQISLQKSFIEQKVHPIRWFQPTELDFRQGQPPRLEYVGDKHS